MTTNDLSLEISTHEEGDLTILLLSGQLTVETVFLLKDTINRFDGEKRKNIIVDMEKVRIMDSAGVSAIAFVGKICRSHGGRLKIVSPNATVLSVFKTLRFDKLFEIFQSSKSLRSKSADTEV